MSTKENREKEAKKLKYKKMGFSKMMDSGEIDFGDGKKSSKKSFEHPMAEERFQQTARARLKKSGLEDSEIGDPRTKTEIKDNAKKMGGGMMQRPMGYTKGGSQQGYGAARTSGMGLQDEKLKPGKVYKAKRGSGLDLPVINSVKPTVNKTKRAQNLSGMKIQFNKQRSRSGINPNSLKKILMKTKNPYSDLVKTTDAGPKKYSSIPGASNSTFTERRKLLGATTGESGSTFTERRKLLRATAKAASATKIGKIALGVGAAGVAAQQYLKSKMKKDENEKTLKDFREQKKPGIPSEKTKTINSALNKLSKKMGGGIMKKYNMGGVSSKEVYLNARANVNAENRKYMNMDDLKEARRETYATAKDRYNISSSDKDILLRKAQQDRQDQTRKRILSRPDRPAEIPERLRRLKPKKVVGRNMGGMMQRPMGYRSGTMVKARGCKLGRTRPTKIT